MCGDLAPKRTFVDEVDERALAVDLDHWQPLPVPRLEIGVSVDLDVLQLEGNVFPHALHDVERALAEVAAGRPVEDDARRYG